MDMNFIKADWPRITVDQVPREQREWVHVEIPRYYLWREAQSTKAGTHGGKWVVIDRYSDYAVTRPFRRKTDCIRAFGREFGRETND